MIDTTIKQTNILEEDKFFSTEHEAYIQYLSIYSKTINYSESDQSYLEYIVISKNIKLDLVVQPSSQYLYTALD